MGHEQPAFCFARVLVIYSLALVCCVQRSNSRAVTTFSIFYDGTSFQHMAALLIFVFTLCYGPGLLFRGPFCI